MAEFKGRQIAPFDLALMGAGLVMFVDSFLPWFGVSLGPYSASTSGWNSGFTAWFPILLVVAIGVIVALRVFAGTATPQLGPIGPTLLLAGLGALATLLILIRWATLPSVAGIDSGARFGLFLGLVVALVATGVSVVAFRASGEALPGREQRRPLP